MTEELNYEAMPIKEADKYIQDQMALHRDQLSIWRLRRGQLLLREREAGRSVEEIAAEISTTRQVVYDLTREAKRAAQTEKKGGDAAP